MYIGNQHSIQMSANNPSKKMIEKRMAYKEESQ